MNLVAALLLLAPLAESRLSENVQRRAKAGKGPNKGPTKPSPKMGAPHEVHQFEQTKFYDEPDWDCRYDNIEGVVGCLACKNPRPEDGNALIVEVKAMYKRADYNIKDESVNKPRKHCIYPERGEFWTCFNSNLVIEPDTTWLGNLKDKPIYKDDGSGDACTDDEIEAGGCVCYPGALAAKL